MAEGSFLSDVSASLFFFPPSPFHHPPVPSPSSFLSPNILPSPSSQQTQPLTQRRRPARIGYIPIPIQKQELPALYIYFLSPRRNPERLESKGRETTLRTLLARWLCIIWTECHPSCLARWRRACSGGMICDCDCARDCDPHFRVVEMVSEREWELVCGVQ